METTLGEPRFDAEGRFIAAHFGRMAVASIYFPKGSGRDRDNSRVPYKLDFYAAVFDRLQSLRRRGPVYAVGDYNTAHEAIDLARPKSNVKASGFLPEERAELTRWLSAGWWTRSAHAIRGLRATIRGGGSGAGARERNVGWRIDYVLASPSAAKRLTDAFVWPQVTGSDHCPVGVDLSP